LQEPGGDLGVEGEVGDEDVLVVGGGDGEPFFPGGFGEGLEEGFSGGGWDGEVVFTVDDEGGEGEVGGFFGGVDLRGFDSGFELEEFTGRGADGGAEKGAEEFIGAGFEDVVESVEGGEDDEGLEGGVRFG